MMASYRTDYDALYGLFPEVFFPPISFVKRSNTNPRTTSLSALVPLPQSQSCEIVYVVHVLLPFFLFKIIFFLTNPVFFLSCL